MPDELFRVAHFHNSAPNSNIVGHTPHFYSHIGAGHKGIKPLMCKHNVVYDLLTLASFKRLSTGRRCYSGNFFAGME